MSNRLRVVHRASALLIGLFLAAHIGNHLIGLAGPSAHLHAMAALRRVYRKPFVEPILLLLLFWQMASGTALVIRGWRARAGVVAWLQAISGLYLLAFVGIHVAAVMAGRYSGLDTNIYFAAAGFHVPGWPWFFAPYYSLAVAALFTHIGTAIYWHRAPRRGRSMMLAGIVGTGLVAAAAITLSMAMLTMPPGRVGFQSSVTPSVSARSAAR